MFNLNLTKMKVKINQILQGSEEQALKGPKGNPLTMREVCINSLLIPSQGDDEKLKWERYEIFKKLRDAKDEVELKLEELNIIKKSVGRTQPPLIMGQCFEILEGK